MHLPLQIRLYLRRTWLRKALMAYRHWGLDEHDVFLASYPKSGSTWLRTMLTPLLTQGIEQQELVDHRFIPGLQYRRKAIRLLPRNGRLIKTHESYQPCYRKAIYVVRDGRDVAVSYYFHLKRTTGYDANFAQFIGDYLTGQLDGFGAWQDHATSWLHSPLVDSDKLLLIKYECLKRDPIQELNKITDFLSVEQSPELLREAVEAGDIKKMRKKEVADCTVVHREQGETIPVVRKGIVGDWKNHFGDDLHEIFWEYAGEAMNLLDYPRELSVDPSELLESS